MTQWSQLNMYKTIVQLCTNSSAGEGLGGTAGGASTWLWVVVWCWAWSGALTSTVGFEGRVAGFFRFSGLKWTESKAVCVRGWEGMGSLCDGEEVDAGEPVLLVLGSTLGWVLRWAGGSGMVTGVSLREDTLRAWTCLLVTADALQLLRSFGNVGCCSGGTGIAPVSEQT